MIEALATIVYRDEAMKQGREVVEILKDNLPRQMFAVKIQAALQGKVISRETFCDAQRRDR